MHLAGVNRASDEDLVDGNIALGEDVANAVRSAGDSPPVVVFANSSQVGNGSPYGVGKERAADALRRAGTEMGTRVCAVPLPNIFGEHGNPDYNSFVATFIAAAVRGDRPVINDRELGLLHAQDAAQALMDAVVTGDATSMEPTGSTTSVESVWTALQRFQRIYVPSGDVPLLEDKLDVDLFNSYRAALFPSHYPIALQPRTDARGRLVETVRAHGRGGQTFVSTTVPGVTRGDHFHLSKLERFVVLEGSAVIRLRKLFTSKVMEFEISGDVPVAIDMPTMWLHNITNVGDTMLTTLFWTDTLFDPANPDTIHEPVAEHRTEER